jgi:hypothetical protein
LQNADKILHGMTNKVANHFRLLSDEKKEIIADRMERCLGCPYNSINARVSQEYEQLTGKHYDTARPELHCSLCGCILEIKTSSLSSDCGIVDWNEDNPDKQLEPKWTKHE